MADTSRLLVAGAAEPTLQYALAEARDAVVESGTPVEVVVLVDPDERAAVERRLGGLDVPPGVTVRVVDTADALAAIRARADDAEQILVDPGTLGPDAVREATETPIELAPAGRQTRHPRLRHRATTRRFVGTFLVSYAFYLLLGDPLDPFDLVTGAAAAGVVAATLAPVVFDTEPTVGRTLPRIARATLFLPYLLYEIVRANVAIAAVILSPSLPIDPETVVFQPDVEDRFGRAVLANAITLTPGTLTVDADEEGLLVHSLTAESREGLAGGPLERAVRFVFEGGAS
ncbi:Na+/H+ antiporter subunit E [Halapricum hydrolyticum]|uniref:Na+/H+ antiporter subunit E n=1 Tax=Halapricum hydrolyticum TaxID=2979991 RepID=A0AAE3IBY5_9EURY|nr:Na+/H+ antiporter subunit E [Halapricum hydrolyticum]MCU4718779.1 Na+/H+ antiporter subunit E [Halapricum hydrolyticum]MCU4727813.1 Na+/H+ antiporter subunit E [Halapricum hydrolyticum]